MRYLPKSPTDREAMLKAIGLRSVDELFAPVPAEYRLNRDLKVPRQMAESEIVDFFRQRSHENGDGYTSFLGEEIHDLRFRHLARNLQIAIETESEIVDFFRQRSHENGDGYTSFLGEE